MQQLKTQQDAITFLVNCVEELLEGYEFKLNNILDADRCCIHHTNSVAIRQLDRAFMRFKEIEQWHKENET